MPTQQLLNDLHYICSVNTLLIKRGCKSPNADGLGMLTPDEQELRDRFQAEGQTVQAFVDALLVTREVAASEARVLREGHAA